jgi:hypothetical protein
MTSDIDFQVKFQHVMSHTFPGFFSAITLFMFMDILSPLELTSLVVSSINNLVSFIGLILIIGTILGIILDGIHHTVIEDLFFDNMDGYKETKYVKYQWMKKCGGLLPTSDSCKENTCSDCSDKDSEKCPILKIGLTRHYSFKTIESKVTELNNFFIDDYYCYSEFYSNTFLSLIPFSLIVPYFLLETFEVTWNWSALLGFISFSFAWICLYCSYSSYKTYAKVVNSVMFGYIKANTGSSNTDGGQSIDLDGKLTWNIKGKLPIEVDKNLVEKIKGGA